MQACNPNNLLGKAEPGFRVGWPVLRFNGAMPQPENLLPPPHPTPAPPNITKPPGKPRFSRIFLSGTWQAEGRDANCRRCFLALRAHRGPCCRIFCSAASASSNMTGSSCHRATSHPHCERLRIRGFNCLRRQDSKGPNGIGQALDFELCHLTVS